MSPMCGCGLEIESSQYIFSSCHLYHVGRSELLNSLYDIDSAINERNEDSNISFVWFGSDKYHKEANIKIFLKCITYFKPTKRFDEPLLWP